MSRETLDQLIEELIERHSMSPNAARTMVTKAISSNFTIDKSKTVQQNAENIMDWYLRDWSRSTIDQQESRL